MEPTSFTVKEESSFKAGESDFTKTKLMTRLTYTLDGMTGSFKVSITPPSPCSSRAASAFLFCSP
jgi:hypothetical protein